MNNDNAPTAEPVAQGEAVQQEEYGGPDFEERCETLAKIERDMRIYLDEDMLLTPYTLELLCNRIKNVRDAGHDNVVMSLYNFRTVRRLAAQPRAVPDGWALVPREPTKEMIEQGASSLQVDVDFTRRPQLPTRQRAARNAYVSMLITAAKQADR